MVERRVEVRIDDARVDAWDVRKRLFRFGLHVSFCIRKYKSAAGWTCVWDQIQISNWVALCLGLNANQLLNTYDRTT